jgi:hypothetical protein
MNNININLPFIKIPIYFSLKNNNDNKSSIVESQWFLLTFVPVNTSISGKSVLLRYKILEEPGSSSDLPTMKINRLENESFYNNYIDQIKICSNNNKLPVRVNFFTMKKIKDFFPNYFKAKGGSEIINLTSLLNSYTMKKIKDFFPNYFKAKGGSENLTSLLNSYISDICDSYISDICIVFNVDDYEVRDLVTKSRSPGLWGVDNTTSIITLKDYIQLSHTQITYKEIVYYL